MSSPNKAPLNDEQAVAALSPLELAMADAALAHMGDEPLLLDLAYLHQKPKIVEMRTIADVGRHLSVLKDDVRTLVVRRLGGVVLQSMEAKATSALIAE